MNSSDPSSARPVGLLVLGMHRSGTSALTGVLERLGIPVPGELLPPAADNPTGFFENKAIYQFQDRLLAHLGASWDDPMPVSNGFVETPAGEGFVQELAGIIEGELLATAPIFAVKDPRMCRFVPLWQAALARLDVEARVAVPLRHPLDVAGSLAKRNKFARVKSFMLWLEHTLAAEHQTRGMTRSFLSYDGLLEDWRGTTERLAAELQLTWPKERGRVEAEIDAFLAPDLRHHAARAAIGEATRLDALVSAAWDALLRLVGNEADEGARTALDAVRAELEAATTVLSPYVAWEFRALGTAIVDIDRLEFEKVALINEGAAALERSRLESEAATERLRLVERDHRRTLAAERREAAAKLAGAERPLRERITEQDRELAIMRPSMPRLPELEEAVEALRREVQAKSLALEAMRNSTSWRALQPLRSVGAYLPPSAKVALRRTAKAGWWAVTPWRMPARRRVMEARQREAEQAAALDRIEAARSPAGEAAAIASAQPLPASRPMLGPRPLKIFAAQGDAPRLSMVTDSINAGSLFGGVATALIFSALLARQTGRRLRIVTRTEAPAQENVAAVFRAHGIEWTGNVEFAFADLSDETGEIDAHADEIFVTTSWWTTHSTRQVIAEERILYILQEDERMFYPFGDNYLLCSETLSDARIRKVINSALLHRHLVNDGVIAEETAYFEPAFPDRIYFPEPNLEGKRTFFFYARPNNPRNLYERGIAAIEGAIEEGILDPETWDICFVGKDLEPMTLAGSVKPVLRQNMAWEEYAAFVRSVDLALTLMYTPHPSYPPLDVAACGGVAVTNRFANKTDLSGYSRSILTVDADVASLIEGLRAGMDLAMDETAREAAFAGNGILRDWNAAFAPVLGTLVKDGALVR